MDVKNHLNSGVQLVHGPMGGGFATGTGRTDNGKGVGRRVVIRHMDVIGRGEGCPMRYLGRRDHKPPLGMALADIAIAPAVGRLP